ncbi:uncharacterized protein LOC130712828 [Lotus japonicus]|uniref:uncharacterized protein LOC130712828 n=1 Tax=Lotus japonicus TaxID=34305 RepID=UPI00258B2E08|nr:uncharacterized protein LOC130712828 [Lotus japonicus]
MIESQRLSFVRRNQNLIRVDFLNGLEEAIDRGETDPTTVGMHVILPSSFMGGMQYMFNNCQDAMAICKKYGYPNLFITATCNAAWSEIKRYVRPMNPRPDDRPDICCRVFKMKLDQMMSDFKQGAIFGGIEAGMYTIEFQKRGLPHAHILLWLKGEHKIVMCADIDKHISIELPDPTLFPKLSKAVSRYMMHEPCGTSYPKSPCMSDGKCTKFFPKKYQPSTSIDEDGYLVYRRRDTGIHVTKNGVPMDNGYVVPYNPHLLMRYRGHTNVEYCNKSDSIKYLFKYVSKGPDRVSVHITNENNVDNSHHIRDEIKQYYDCRWPPVKRLNFHLENQQRILFKDDEDLEEVINKPSSQITMFLAWMRANRQFQEARDMTYAEFPNKFVFDRQSNCWRPRKKGYSIGRLQYVPPGIGELYYLRILLTVQKGCTSFESIRTVKGVVYPTFHDACYALGLLADDREYIDAIIEASDLGSGNQLRKLFVFLITSSTMNKAELVWEKTWMILSDGIVHSKRKWLGIPADASEWKIT